MPKYLDPKADVVFKKIFAEHPPLLISFLNALMPLPVDCPIIEIEYLPAEQTPSIPGFKRTVVDVKCRDKSGRVFIVEMQINWTDSFKQRLLFGTSQAVVKQLNKGQVYCLLQPVYGLGIIADTFDEGDEWYHHYQLVKTTGKNPSIIEHLQLIFVELPKFPRITKEHKKLRILWLRFLREIGEETQTVSPDLYSVHEIAEAIELAEQAAYTPNELNAYEAYWDSVRIEKTLIADKYEEGRMEGRMEGRIEGRVEERKILIQQMINVGIELEEISKITGISLKELKTLL